jgi:hypothetical protein
MTATAGTPCPNGHVSGDPDWCDTCGAPMSGGASSPASDPTSATEVAGAVTGQGGVAAECPHCGASNPPDSLFCESCGYDFTTGQIPESTLPAEGTIDPARAATSSAGSTGPSDDHGGENGETGRTGADGVAESSSTATVAPWVVIVEVDAAWHALKGELADRPLPSPSTSTVPLFQHTSLIGRTSQSRGLRPEVALDLDTAVSRRHAQFVVEGELLSVVDLSSTNGTYVLPAAQAPTDDAMPLASGVSTALSDGDQVFLGAWSRLTVRRV